MFAEPKGVAREITALATSAESAERQHEGAVGFSLRDGDSMQTQSSCATLSRLEAPGIAGLPGCFGAAQDRFERCAAKGKVAARGDSKDVFGDELRRNIARVARGVGRQNIEGLGVGVGLFWRAGAGAELEQGDS
jgi:hypothetical protein